MPNHNNTKEKNNIPKIFYLAIILSLFVPIIINNQELIIKNFKLLKYIILEIKKNPEILYTIFLL